MTNLACSLGRRTDEGRRRAELLDACSRLGISTDVLDPPARIGSGDDLAAAQEDVAVRAAEVASRLGAHLLISPHPQDGHHGHEVVARAARDVVGRLPNLTWWMWGLWADLPMPTLYHPFGDAGLAGVLHAVRAYAGENARNSYDLLVPARARSAAVLGSERIFGFGAARASARPYAELFTEVCYRDGRWRLGAPRVLDPRDPVPSAFADEDVGWWLDAPSPQAVRRARRSAAKRRCDR